MKFKLHKTLITKLLNQYNFGKDIDKNIKSNKVELSEIQRLLFMSRELYHPNLFLDIVREKLNQSQELFFLHQGL